MIGTTNAIESFKEIKGVEWLLFSGAQWFDTGFVPNQNTKIEMEVAFTEITSTENLWCARTAATNNVFTTFKLANKFRNDYGTVQATPTFTIAANTKYKIVQDKEKFYVNDGLLYTHNVSTFTCPDTLTLGMSWIGNHTTTQDNFAKYMLYSCKIYDNGVIVRDFIPKKDGEGVYCLYDKKEKQFYYNQGTGNLIGSDSPIITPANITNYFTVTNSSYYFVGAGTVFTTNNGGKNNSTAQTTLTALYDMDISFNYSYSSEPNYDKFYLTFAGSTIANGLSGATTNKTHTGHVQAGQTITFKYTKDSSSHRNDDKCTFSNMTILNEIEI